MKAANPFRLEVAKETKRSSVRDANGCLQEPKRLFGPSKAGEVFRPTFGDLRDIRIDSQELRNQFAHLLNRGSPLE